MSDDTPSWSAADAALLKQLRTQAGIDRASVARATCLSLAQVSQLEEGGDASFYSPAIKRAAGQRALAWLQSRREAAHQPVQARIDGRLAAGSKAGWHAGLQSDSQTQLQTQLQEAVARRVGAPNAHKPPACAGTAGPRHAAAPQAIATSPSH